MTLNEFNLLKKLMMLASENTSDHEALQAFRRATALLAKHGYNWTQALSRVITVVDEIIDISHERENEMRLFARALQGAGGEARKRLLDIYQQYQHGKVLTQSQWGVVRQAAGDRS